MQCLQNWGLENQQPSKGLCAQDEQELLVKCDSHKDIHNPCSVLKKYHVFLTLL